MMRHKLAKQVEAKVRLGRIGYDNVVGYLADPIQALVEHPAIAERSSGTPVATL